MIKIIAVGKIKEKAMTNLIDEYLKRISGYSKIEIIEVKDFKTPVNSSTAIEDKIIDDEGELVLKKINPLDKVILLDLHGEELDSLKMANKFETLRISATKDLVFVIGGSLGVSNDLRSRSDYLWKMSDLTFTHQFVRLLTLEQIYRFFKINNNEKYHK